jgi:hypothetical protein
MSIVLLALRRARVLAIGVWGIVLLTATPSVVQAIPITINFSVEGAETTTIGVGTAVVDHPHLWPGQFTVDLADLLDFSLTITDPEFAVKHHIHQIQSHAMVSHNGFNGNHHCIELRHARWPDEC